MEVTRFLQGRLNTSIPKKDTLKGCAAQVMSMHGVEVILATASAKKAIACALSFHGWSARSPKDPELRVLKQPGRLQSGSHATLVECKDFRRLHPSCFVSPVKSHNSIIKKPVALVHNVDISYLQLFNQFQSILVARAEWWSTSCTRSSVITVWWLLHSGK